MTAGSRQKQNISNKLALTLAFRRSILQNQELEFFGKYPGINGILASTA